MDEDLPPNIQKFAMIQATLTAGLGFGDDKLQSVLDRADEFSMIANKSNLIDALKDDLDAFSVVVGLSIALKEFATFEADELLEIMKQMAKAEDN